MMQDSAPKPALALCPGLLCDETVWAAQVAAFSGAYDIVIPRFLGLDSIESMASAVLALAPPRFSIVGHSMGGRVALEAFAQAPARIERLALLDTGAYAVAPSEAQSRMALVDLAHQQGMLAVAKAWLPPMVGPSLRDDSAFMAPLIEMVRRAAPGDFAKQQQALLNRPNSEPVLAKIKAPVLLATGEHDHWSPLAQHEDMAGKIADCVLSVIEDCGHMSVVERPEALTRLLRDWLARPA